MAHSSILLLGIEKVKEAHTVGISHLDKTYPMAPPSGGCINSFQMLFQTASSKPFEDVDYPFLDFFFVHFFLLSVCKIPTKLHRIFWGDVLNLTEVFGGAVKENAKVKQVYGL